MIVYKTTDRIPVNVGDIKFLISPLSYHQKQTIISKSQSNGSDVTDSMTTAFWTLKYSIKDVKGLINADGSEYQLSFDEDGLVCESNIDDLTNLPIKEDVITEICKTVANLTDGKLDGIKLESSSQKRRFKEKKQ